MKFFICERCGNLVGMINESGVPMVCCGQNMTELKPGTSDGAFEKHVPVFTVDGRLVHVTVGEAEHPMMPEHHIEWIAIQTANGNQRRVLKPGDKPKACFAICEGDEIKAVYAYCNLHGLWRRDK